MNTIKAGTCKYPKDVFVAQTTTKTLAFRSELVPASAAKGESPYKVYDESFSRFVTTIIHKSKDGRTTFPGGNITVRDIPGIVENSKAAKQADTFLSLPVIHQLFTLVKETNSLIERIGGGINRIYSILRTGQDLPKKESSPRSDVGKLAKTTTISAGNYKGKTPFEILVANPEEAAGLQRQHKWLASNLAQYPNNQVQMDAISEALYMLENGLLQGEDGAAINASQLSLGDVVIYEPVPKALQRKMDDQGFAPVYEIGIVWHMGDRYPVEVSVKNYKAPLNRKDGGVMNPIRSKAIDIVNNTFRLSSSQWFECLYALEAHMSRFEMLHMRPQFQEAELADRLNREQAKENTARENPESPQGGYQTDPGAHQSQGPYATQQTAPPQYEVPPIYEGAPYPQELPFSP